MIIKKRVRLQTSNGCIGINFQCKTKFHFQINDAGFTRTLFVPSSGQVH